MIGNVLEVLGVAEFIMNFEVGNGHDLEERFAVEVHVFE